MDISLDRIPVLIAFFLPGFFWFYVRQNLSHTPSRDLSSFELVMFSLLYSVFITLIEAFLFVIVAQQLGLDIMHAISIPRDQFIIHPVAMTGGVLLWFTLGLFLAYLIARYDPVDKLLERQLIVSGRSSTDIWHNTFARLPSNVSLVDVIVHMKNGDLYAGYLKEYQQNPDRDGHRDFSIAGVCYRPVSGSSIIPSYDRAKLGVRSLSIINTREVKSIDVWLRCDPSE